MKRVLTVLLMLAAASSLFAGGAENKNNLSSGYLRDPSKNTETEKTDAVFYNPAGTAFMEDGLYAEIGNQFVFKNYNHDVTEPTGFDKYESTNPILFYPNTAIVFKKDNFALFGGFSVFGGGGTITYDEGTYLTNGVMSNYTASPLIDDEDVENSLEVFSAAFGELVGGSYAFNDMISLAAAVRFIQGSQTLKAELDNDPTAALIGAGITSKTLLDTEASANGVGFIISLHTKPAEKLDLSLQYHTITKMEYEYDKAEGALAAANGYEEGGKYDRDIPAILGAGIGYQILDRLYSSISFNYYFNEQTDNDLAEFDNSWEIGVGAEYKLTDTADVSAGILYSNAGMKDEENIIEGPVLDSICIGAGTELTFMENLAIDIALFKSFYLESGYKTAILTTDYEMDANKSLLILSIGATYKFF